MPTLATVEESAPVLQLRASSLAIYLGRAGIRAVGRSTKRKGLYDKARAIEAVREMRRVGVRAYSRARQ